MEAVVPRIGADEFHEGDLPTEIESSHQVIVSSRNFESDKFAVQHLGLRGCSLYVICRGPMWGLDNTVPTFECDFCLRMIGPKADKPILGHDPHRSDIACSQYGNKNLTEYLNEQMKAIVERLVRPVLTVESCRHTTQPLKRESA
jgi:hypothetical protein